MGKFDAGVMNLIDRFVSVLFVPTVGMIHKPGHFFHSIDSSYTIIIIVIITLVVLYEPDIDILYIQSICFSLSKHRWMKS